MAYKCREEIVGKRFLSVSSGFSKLKSAKISEWGWRAGVIRASTHKDNNHQDLQVKTVRIREPQKRGCVPVIQVVPYSEMCRSSLISYFVYYVTPAPQGIYGMFAFQIKILGLFYTQADLS